MDIRKQGILTILHSDFQLPSPPPPSLRRTLSADMSSNNFLTHHSIKFNKTPSSSSDGEQEDEDDYNNKIESPKKPKSDDDSAWPSILFRKSADASNPAAASNSVPYVHPLVNKSLTSHSLLLCTESLGSETGSDGFSPHPPSQHDRTIKIDPRRSKKSPPRSFPPPLPSLCSSHGASVSIHSRRENGRLLLDAVSVPSPKIFVAVRRGGRLVLSFVTAPVEEEEEYELQQFEEARDLEIAEENDLETEELEMEIPSPRLSSSVMNFHRLALMMKNKPNGLVIRNPPWPMEKDSSEPLTPLAQSLPPRPPSSLAAAAATSLNAYEYYWRSKPTGRSAGIQNSIGQQQPPPIKKLISSNNQMGNEKQQGLVLRGNRGDYLVPLSNGCKLPRRSLLLRGPCCVATT